MSAALPLEAGPDYPEDLSEALARVYDTARPFSDSEVHALRAALNIALSYVKVAKVRPEVEVMWAEEEIRYPTEDFLKRPVEGRVLSQSVYFVCPSCIHPIEPVFIAEAVESMVASVEYDLDADEGPNDVGLWRGDRDVMANGDSYLVCPRPGCYAEMEAPAWMEYVD